MKVLVLVAGLFGLTCSVAVAGANPFDGTWSEVIVGENQFCAVNFEHKFHSYKWTSKPVQFQRYCKP